MKQFLILIFLTFAVSSIRAELAKSPDLIKLEGECTTSGLACAKAAYIHRKSGNSAEAFSFYKKGCDLGEQSACHNMQNLNPRELYFKKVDALMNYHRNNIINCYIPKARKVHSNTQLKERWIPVSLAIHIDNKGLADSITVKSELGKDFEECAKNVVERINFPRPEKLDPSYQYQLTLRSLE